MYSTFRLVCLTVSAGGKAIVTPVGLMCLFRLFVLSQDTLYTRINAIRHVGGSVLRRLVGTRALFPMVCCVAYLEL